MTTEIKNWLEKEYAEVGIQNLQIDSVMGAIEDTLAEIRDKELFDKRFNVSKNISVLMYKSKSVEVHISIDDILSTYKLFKPQQQTFFVPFQAEEIVWNNCIAQVKADSKEEAFAKVYHSIASGNPFRDFNAEWDGVNTVTSEVVETVKYGIGDDWSCGIEDVKDFQPTTLQKLMEQEGKENLYRFMGDGVVLVKFVDRMNLMKVSVKIRKVPSVWNNKIALSLGYSSNLLAYRNFGGLRRVLEFIDNFSVLMKIDFSKSIK